MIDERCKKIDILGDAFRGLWQIKELKEAIFKKRNKDYILTKWYVTFKYNGDFLETIPKDSMEEALDYAIDFLGLKK